MSTLRRLIAFALIAFAPLTIAQTAIITSAVNVRAGPDRFFPTVTWLISGTRVTVVGCVESWQWCDVKAGRDRGWIYSRYLSYPSPHGNVSISRGGPELGLPAIEFSLQSYWDAEYQNRRWFAQAGNYQKRWERRRPQAAWREPATAQRTNTSP